MTPCGIALCIALLPGPSLPETGSGKAVAHDASITALATVADGRVLVSGDYHGGLRVWDLGSGTLLHESTSPLGGVIALSVDPTGHFVAASCRQGAQIWNLESWEPLSSIALSEPSQTWFLPDGSSMVSWRYGKLWFWNRATGEITRHADGWDSRGFHGFDVIALSKNGERCVFGEGSQAGGYLALGDLSSGVASQLDLGALSPPCYALTGSDGNCAVTLHRDGEIARWDFATGTRLDQFHPHATRVTDFCEVSADGLSASGDESSRILLWRKEKIVTEWKSPDSLQALAYSPALNKIVVACGDNGMGRILLRGIEETDFTAELFSNVTVQEWYERTVESGAFSLPVPRAWHTLGERWRAGRERGIWDQMWSPELTAPDTIFWVYWCHPSELPPGGSLLDEAWKQVSAADLSVQVEHPAQAIKVKGANHARELRLTFAHQSRPHWMYFRELVTPSCIYLIELTAPAEPGGKLREVFDKMLAEMQLHTVDLHPPTP